MPRTYPRSWGGLVALTGATLCAVGNATAQSSAPSARRDSAVVAVERGIWENIKHGRWQGVTGTLGGALTVDEKGIYTWSATNTNALRDMGCTTTAYAMRDVRTREVAADIVALGYHADVSLRCGNATPTLSSNYLSVYRRRGPGWELVATSITRAAAPK